MFAERLPPGCVASPAAALPTTTTANAVAVVATVAATARSYTRTQLLLTIRFP